MKQFDTVVAVIFAVQVFLAVFAAPVLMGNADLMMAWGWVAPFVAVPVAFGFAFLARRIVRSALDRAIDDEAEGGTGVGVIVLVAVVFLGAITAYLIVKLN
jgi:hypothetical protein